MGMTWLLYYLIYLSSFTDWPNERYERKNMSGLPENEANVTPSIVTCREV